MIIYIHTHNQNKIQNIYNYFINNLMTFVIFVETFKI